MFFPDETISSFATPADTVITGMVSASNAAMYDGLMRSPNATWITPIAPSRLAMSMRSTFARLGPAIMTMFPCGWTPW